jgi:hypothetical protein
MNVWLVGQWKKERWEVQGVFDTKDAAIAACRDYFYFVMPLEMNKQLPHETMQNKDTWYPIKAA